MIPQDLAKMIHDARIEKCITQAQLAEMIGVGKPTVNQFETGKQNITVEVLCKMLTALNMVLIPADQHRMSIINQIEELAKQL